MKREDYKLAQKEYAVKYGRSLSCIKRWYAKSLPLDDEAAMQGIIKRGVDQAGVYRDRRLQRRSSVYVKESDFQASISSFFRRHWVFHVPEFVLPGSQHRGDFLLQKHAVECKITADSALHALGQLLLYKRVTQRTPVLLVPNDIVLDRQIVDAVEAIPALVMNETAFCKMFASKEPPRLPRTWRRNSQESHAANPQETFGF